MTIQFNVRIFLRTGIIERLLKFSDVTTVLFWDDAKLKKELSDLGCGVILQADLPKLNTLANISRSIKNNLHHNKNIDHSSFEIEQENNFLISQKKQEQEENFKVKLYKRSIKILASFPFIEFFLDLLIKPSVRKNHEYKKIEQILKKNQCTHMISATPYLIQEDLYLLAAKWNNIHTTASVLSFDNIVSRNNFSIKFDNYFVWNNYNKNELNDIYNIDFKKIEIIGPLQFDFYYSSNNLISEKEWRDKFSIPNNRKIILFAGGYIDVVPNEQDWLEMIDNCITNGEIRDKPIILFRIHPVDPIGRWKKVLDKSKNIIFMEPWNIDTTKKGHTNIQLNDIANLCSTLNWSDVHINASSTMTVDGAIYDKPQIGPAFDDIGNKIFDKNIKALYQRKHFQPITNSGGLTLATSKKELVESINDALVVPDRLSKQRKRLVKEICHFHDGKSADRFIKKIKSITL